VARTSIVGNGPITVTGDPSGALRELYVASPAPETQILRRPARIGLAVEGVLRWLPEGFVHARGDVGLSPIADLSLVADDLGLELWIETFVEIHAPTVVRRVQITNRSAVQRSLTLYFHHDFRLAEGRPHERAHRDEQSGGLLHASGRRAVLFQLETHQGIGVPLVRVAARGAEDAAGADAEARHGASIPLADATGWVDSVGGVPLALEPGGSAMVTASLTIGATAEEARGASTSFHEDGVSASLTRTRAHWTLWANEGARDFGDLPEDVGAVYGQSLLALRLHQTPEGAIVSAPGDAQDPDRHRDGRWCRVAAAAIAADALGRAGYLGAARRYFAFIERSARRNGRLAPIVDTTGAAVAVPGVPDSSLVGDALHLWAAARHAARDRDVEFLSPLWRSTLAPAAARLAAALDPVLGLPVSTDWWGERRGVCTPVAGAVRGGLRAAARLAALFGEATAGRAWTLAADRIAHEAARRLRDAESERYWRRLRKTAEGWEADTTADASLLLLGLLDDFEPEDPRIRATVAYVKRQLWARAGSGGIARYEGDRAGRERAVDVPEGVEFPQIATTMWLALHEAKAARRLEDLESVRTLLFWAAARAEGAGLLPEWLHPARGRVDGSAPSLTAHAWFVHAALEYAERGRLLTRCDRCGEPGPVRRDRRQLTVRVPAAPLPPGVVANL
jgi:GH15 family glucan-1,4-alpha-glucosidase